MTDPTPATGTPSGNGDPDRTLPLSQTAPTTPTRPVDPDATRATQPVQAPARPGAAPGNRAQDEPAADATHGTAPVLGDAPTMKLDATRSTASAQSASAETLPTHGAAGTHRASAPDGGTAMPLSLAPNLPRSGTDVSPATGARVSTGTFARTGWTQRVTRTKLNASLPPSAQELDAKLQMSRPSVLADMAAVRTDAELPAGVRKLIEEQGTEGRYAVVKELAHGGMGAVLDISDHDFRRRAAMKVILSRFATSPEAVERFLAEAQVTAQLEHPNIVPIHDLGVMEDGTLYFTMKLVEGLSLGRVVKLLQQDRGQLVREGAVVPPDDESRAATAHWTEDEKLHVFLKVLDGVGFAHSRGVVHRDIKPDNIMLGGHGEVLVVDWGIAKVLDAAARASRAPVAGDAATIMSAPAPAPQAKSEIGERVASLRDEGGSAQTMAGAAMGTIFYMPPEQATGDLERIDARSDVYALGATLYELLALKRALPGAPLAEMIARIVEGRFVPLDDVAPHVDRDLVAIVHRAMARDPAKRYASCDAFAEDLRRYLAGAAVLARKRSTAEIVRLWVQQNRTRIAVAGGAAALLVATVVATTWWVRARDREQGRDLYAQAQAAYARTAEGADATPEALREIQALLVRADDKLPGDDAVRTLAATVAGKLGQAEERAQAEAKRRADSQAAETIAAQADAALKGGDPVAAERAYRQALALAPSDARLQQALIDVGALARDAQRAEKERAARAHRDQARAALADAEPLDPLDPKSAPLVERAAAELALADADPQVKVDGLPELAQAIGARRAAATRAAKQAEDLARGRQLATQAAETAAKDPTRALALAQQAMAFAPADSAVQQAHSAAATAKATADAETAAAKRRSDADAHAAQQLELARTARKEMEQARAEHARATAEAVRLERELADKDLSDKKAKFVALQAARAARQRLVQTWAACEGHATAAATALEPWAPPAAAAGAPPVDPASLPPAYRESLVILAGLYHNRLLEARAAGNLPEIQAFRNLLARADRYERAYAAVLANVAVVTVTGKPDGAVVMARPLLEQADTRLGPAGEPMKVPLDQRLELAAGTWQFSAGDTVISWPLSSERPTTIAWPAAHKAIPGIPLRHVPADLRVGADGKPLGRKPFLLGVTEVTVEQYFAFLKDPAVFAQLRKELNRHVEQAEDGATSFLPASPMPWLARGAPAVFEPVLDGNRNVFDLRLMTSSALDEPVTNINRADAEAYCTWLSKKHGVRARLPTSDEFAFAAGGDDPQRLYPWGPHFDGNFAVTSSARSRAEPARVRSVASDIGPFGHHDLGGNVREWLGDLATVAAPRNAGAHRGLIGGGGYGDDHEHWFRVGYVESVDPSMVRNEVIGFRILVELP